MPRSLGFDSTRMELDSLVINAELTLISIIQGSPSTS
jgi:hypothetical protein